MKPCLKKSVKKSINKPVEKFRLMRLPTRILMHISIMLCLASSIASADELGRLFTSPAQRAQLDNLRRNMRALPEKLPTQEDSSELTPGAAISVQGYVRRSDGKPGTVWVNQQPVQENKANGTMIVDEGKSRQVEITLPGTGQSVKLKAGQVYMPASNTIQEYKATAGTPSTLPNENEHTDAGKE